jgi:hypothetical protein
MGVFAVDDGGTLTGSDCFGGKYAGTVTEDPTTGNFIATFTQFVPRGVTLVQGTSPMDFDSRRALTLTFPPAFGDGKPTEHHIPPGLVYLMIKRVPDDYANYAAGLSLVADSG